MRLLASVFLVCLSSSIFGQGFSTIQVLQMQFDQAVASDDRPTAFRAFHQLFTLDSNLSYSLASGLATMINNDDPHPGLLDTLVSLYRIGSRQAPESAADLAQKQAFLALRFPEYFEQEKTLWLKQAIHLDPFQCALQLYRFWGDGLEAGQMPNSLWLVTVAEDWAAIDRYLYARELLFPEEAKAIHRVRTRIHCQLASLAPGCDEIQDIFTVSSENSHPFHGLVLFSLLRCQDTATWLRYSQNLSGSVPSWAYRLLANHYLNIGQTQKCLETLKLAILREELPILKADLHFHIALLMMKQGEYQAARSQVQTAIRLAPEWGDLHLFLADIYLEGASLCDFNEFESKAVYWLAIDLAQKAISSSPHLQQEANQRIFEYKLYMPGKKQIEFHRLSAGDTWPLNCWMNTVTTVKEN